MSLTVAGSGPSPTIRLLREATGAHHERLESRFDAVAQLSDASRRHDVLRRYAALHVPADAALAPFLEEVPGLDFKRRQRGDQLAAYLGEGSGPEFPLPRNRCEALGMLYVLEGSTLGGRLILRELAAGGTDLSGLAFLNPYQGDTGQMWRSFLAVLERETAAGGTSMEDAARGATRGFAHAELVLCGETS